jgi:hypothetical protein
MAHLENYNLATGGVDMRALTLKSLFLALTVVTILQRLYLWARAKGIVQFFRKLETYDYFATRRERLEDYPIWFVWGIGIGYFLLRVGGALTNEAAEVAVNAHAGNFLIALGPWILIPLSTFSKIVTYLVTYVCLGLIFTSTTKLMFVLEDFCDHLEFSIEMASSDLSQILCTSERKGNVNATWKQIGPSDYFLQKLENLKALFRHYDCLFGPLYLSYLISSFVGILHGTNEILVEKKCMLELLTDVLKILAEFHFILVIEGGHFTRTLVNSIDHLKSTLN